MKTEAPECLNCSIAGFGPWRVYSARCADCDIREIANTDSAQRPALYERIERECGRKALECVKECVKERVGREIVRQRLLRDGRAPVK